MLTFLWIIYIIDCVLLVGIILLQPGEGGDLAAAFGVSSSQTAFGSRGSATVLQKATTTLAVTFMVLSIVLVILTNIKQKNIMERMPAAATVPEQPEDTPTETPAEETRTDGASTGETTEPGTAEAAAETPEGTDVADDAEGEPAQEGEAPASDSGEGTGEEPQ